MFKNEMDVDLESQVLYNKLKNTCVFIHQIFQRFRQQVHNMTGRDIINQIRQDKKYFDIWKTSVSFQFPDIQKWFNRLIQISIHKIYGYSLPTNHINLKFWQPCFNHFLKIYYVNIQFFEYCNYEINSKL